MEFYRSVIAFALLKIRVGGKNTSACVMNLSLYI